MTSAADAEADVDHVDDIVFEAAAVTAASAGNYG